MKSLRVVLVASKYPRNVGMVSRILCNYDVDRLILVRPQCELNEEAKQGAARGQKALENSVIYDTWEDFYKNEPDGLRIGFSRRQGKRRASVPLNELLDEDVLNLDRPVYLLFGAEDHGLSAEDLDMVHRMAYFDLPGEVQSMNLSHSVLVALSQFYNKFGVKEEKVTEIEPIRDPEPILRLWLESLNFDLDSQNRWNMLTMVKQLIMRANPTNDEIHKLEMVIQQTVRKIKNDSISQ